MNDAELELTIADEPITDRLGPYRLCFEIASGGMASVYLGVKEGPGGFVKRVALKRVHAHLTSDRSFCDMFNDEARIASSIHHPNVCEVLDFGEADGSQFIAMEYLMGESLRAVQRVLATEDLRFRQLVAARVIADACEGLHAAHELRDDAGQPMMIVHRDVSPQNLMVTYEGAVKVMDFGIATASNRVHHTATGTVKGKFAYMPPEQLRGKAVDRRADVWSLGVLLWETITAAKLFHRGNDSETMLAVLTDPIPSLASSAQGVSDVLVRIVEKAVQRDREARFATAAEMSRELRRYIASREELMDAVELAKWMKASFPKGLAQKQQLVAIASQAHDGVPRIRAQEGSGSLRRQASMVRPKRSRRAIALWIAGATALAVTVLGALLIGIMIGEGGDDAPVAAQPIAAPRAIAPTPIAPTPIAPTPIAIVATPPIAPPISPTPAITTTPAIAPTPIVPQSPEPTPARAERRVAPRPVQGEGSVDLVTPGGWADVYHQGRRVGQTPGRFRLPAGAQRLSLRPFGNGASRTVVVTIRPGETVRMRVDLEP